MNEIPEVDYSSANPLDIGKMFLNDPVKTVDALVSRCELKGNNLSAIRKLIVENASKPEMTEWMWLVFSPRIASIMVTQDRCNLACRMCGGSKGKLKYLKADVFEMILRHIPTIELVTLVSGNSEPLMSPAMPGILRCAKEAKVNLDIVTNGHLLSSDLIDMMLETGRPTGLNISIDAAHVETYRNIRGASLDKVLRNLELLRDRKKAMGCVYPNVSLLMVGMADNIEELPDLVSLAARLNATRVHVDHMKGQYEPGDFTTNPKWGQFVLKASETARALNVNLELPVDAIISLSMNSRGAPAVGDASASPAKDSPAPKPKLSYCSWIQSIQIDITGTLSPCCHNPKVLGNILNDHISKQVCYLRYRLENLGGKVEPFCLSAKNCAYVEEWRALGLVPPTFQP